MKIRNVKSPFFVLDICPVLMTITHLSYVHLKATMPCPYILTSYSLISIDHVCTMCTL